MGLGGPSVEGTQTNAGREFTFQEKLDVFLEHLESEHIVAESRVSFLKDIQKTPFCSESVRARRCRIERGGDALNIWVSPQTSLRGEEKRGYDTALYLIEDYAGDDEHPHKFSGYSSLLLLANELDSVRRSFLIDSFHEIEHQDASRRFAADPVRSLEEIGAKVGPEREVHTIYRFRASCIDQQQHTNGIHMSVTVGYPLVISEN